MVERGPYVSYANCGLPYFIGGVIEQQASLLVATADTFRDMFNVDARTDCEVVGIDARGKTVQLKDRTTGEVSTEAYDKLVLSPGSRPHPPAAARHRPARDLRREDGARCRPDPCLGRGAARQDGRHGHLHRHADAAAGAPRGRRGRRVHRHRDGREPGGPRLRGHTAAARRPDHGRRSTRRWRATWSAISARTACRWCSARARRRSGRRTTGRSRSSSGRTRSTPPTSSSSASA